LSVARTVRIWWSVRATAPAVGATVPHRVGEVAADEGVDLAVEGGGEQQPLPSGRYAVQQRRDRGQEAHVGHVVGLVHDGDGDRVQRAGVLAQQIQQPPGGGDDDVGAAPELLDLSVERHPAVDGQQPQS
jgi:hypothetical protein